MSAFLRARGMRAGIAAAALLALGGCGVFKGAPKKTPTVGNRVPILVSETSVQADPSLAAIEVTLPAPAANDG